jgi:hypothetical protein
MKQNSTWKSLWRKRGSILLVECGILIIKQLKTRHTLKNAMMESTAYETVAA